MSRCACFGTWHCCISHGAWRESRESTGVTWSVFSPVCLTRQDPNTTRKVKKEKRKKMLVLTGQHQTCAHFRGKPLFPSNKLTGKRWKLSTCPVSVIDAGGSWILQHQRSFRSLVRFGSCFRTLAVNLFEGFLTREEDTVWLCRTFLLSAWCSKGKRETGWYYLLNLFPCLSDSLPESGKKTGICQSCPPSAWYYLLNLFPCLSDSLPESGKKTGICQSCPLSAWYYLLNLFPCLSDSLPESGKKTGICQSCPLSVWYYLLNLFPCLSDSLPESGKKTGICQSCPLSVRLVTRKREKDLSFPLWAWLGMRKRKGSSRDYVARLCAWIGERSGKEIDATVVQFSLMSGWFGGRSGEVWC